MAVISTAGSNVSNGQFSQFQFVPLPSGGGLQGGRFSLGVQGGTGPLQLPVGAGLQVPVPVPTSPTAIHVPLNVLLQSMNGHGHPPAGHLIVNGSQLTLTQDTVNGTAFTLSPHLNGSLLNQLQSQSLSVQQQHQASLPSQPLQVQAPQLQTQAQVVTLGSALAAMSGMTLLSAGNSYALALAQAQAQMAGLSGAGTGAGDGRAGPPPLQLQLQLQQLQQLQAPPNANAPALANANAHAQTPTAGTHASTPGIPVRDALLFYYASSKLT